MAFNDCGFNETMEIMLKLNKNRNTEFRMELCFDNPYLPEEKSIPLFCIGVLVVDGVASGYANLAIKGIEVINKNFDMQLLPSKYL